MPASGTYTEPLTSGGKLTVTRDEWSIDYYFSGPDLRYNGTFVSVPGKEVQVYIAAYEQNWVEYEHLKKMAPPGTTLEKPGREGMVIRVGGHWPGVSIRSYHMPIASRDALNKLISDYQYAAQRAAAIQRLLAAV